MQHNSSDACYILWALHEMCLIVLLLNFKYIIGTYHNKVKVIQVLFY